MAAPVIVRFQVAGVEQVRQALRSIQQATIDGERQSVSAVQRASKERVAVVQREASEIIQKQKEKADREKAFEKDVLETGKKFAKEHTKAVEDENRRRLSIIERSATMAGQIAKKQADEEIAALKTVAKAREQFATAMAGAAARGWAATAGTIGNISRGLVGTALQMGGGFSIGDALQKKMADERAVAEFANSTYKEGGTRMTAKDQKGMLDKARALSIKYNMDATEIIGGAKGFNAKSGANWQESEANMEFYAKLAKGGNVKGGAAAVGEAAGWMKAQNKNLSTKDQQEFLMAMVGQGREGTIEIEDMARISSQLTRSGGQYSVLHGHTQMAAQRDLLALAQAVAPSTGKDPRSAGTAVSNLGIQAKIHRKNFDKSLFDEQGNINNVEDLLAWTMSKTKGDAGAIKKLGFTLSSQKVFDAFAPDFNEDGEAGVRKKFQRFSKAGYSESSLDADVANVMQTSGERAEQAMREFSQAIADELLPQLTPLIGVLKDVTPAFTTILREGVPAFAELVKTIAHFVKENEWAVQLFASHPFATIAAAHLAKSLGSEFITQAVGGALARAIGSSAAGNAVGGGGGGGAAAGALGIAAGIGVGLYGAYKTFDEMVEGGQGASNKAQAVLQGVQSGAISEAQAKQMLADAEATDKEGSQTGFNSKLGIPLMGVRMVDAISKSVTGSELFGTGEQMRSEQEATALKGKSKEIEVALDGLKKALDAKTAALGQTPGLESYSVDPGTSGKPQTDKSRGGAGQ